MKARLKPLSQQTIVVTGASSGNGLATARRAARAGAKLVLASRNEAALRAVRDELRSSGSEAEFVVDDVGHRDDVAEIARTAERAFGGFDTWVNNAGTGTFGKVLDTPFDDLRKVFETNFWGVVYGSVAAVEHLRSRPGGGKLINMGSVLGDFGVPEQAPYVASKHAVKGFTNTLRIEVIRDRIPVSITLIKPSAMATPFKEHARNYMDSPGRTPPPVYAPHLVADAVLYAAQHHVRDLTVGSAGRAQALLQKVVPGLADRAFAVFGPPLQKDLRPDQRIVREGNLFEPGQDGAERTDLRFVREHSLYTAAQTHPRATAALALLAGALAGGALVSSGRVKLRKGQS